MKHFLFVIIISIFTVKALGQQSVDLGFYGGVGTYLGDMSNVNLSKSVSPAYGSFIRYNFNPRYALRFNLLNGTISADGQYNSDAWSFSKNVLDLSLSFEFNYMKYIIGEKETPYSTFIFGGIGMHTYSFSDGANEGSEISPIIPFGLGFKFDLNKRIGVGIEGSLRKTFSDKLDNLDDPLSYMNEKNIEIKYSDYYHNNDWTAYFGVHIVYKLIYGNKTWEMRTPKSKMIDWGITNSNRKE